MEQDLSHTYDLCQLQQCLPPIANLMFHQCRVCHLLGNYTFNCDNKCPYIYTRDTEKSITRYLL